jgi:hypothetical protein
MATMRIVTTFIMMSFLFALAGSLEAATLSFDELMPTAIVVTDHNLDTWKRVRAIAEKAGAHALMMYPPDVVFGRFEGTIDRSLFAGLPVAFAFTSEELAGTGLGTVVSRVVAELFDYRQILASAPPMHGDMHMDDAVLRVPEEIVRATTPPGPRCGSPQDLEDRGISQNSEFMIGSVCLNIIFPESHGSEEDWTTEKMQECLGALSLGLQQYQQQALWTDLSFIVNNLGVAPVTMEPIDGDMSTDPQWINEALTFLGYSGGPFVGTHALNNAMRKKFNTDWVYSSYIVNMTGLDEQLRANCWGGAGYVAYSYLGGPYNVVPYPACRYGYGLGFGRVYIHEMSHGFWALDEYASAGVQCTEKSGYLAVPTMNSLYTGLTGQTCIQTVPCIMQTADPPITSCPICNYTLGQVGLWDNGNSVPLIFNVAPQFLFNEGVTGNVDTLLPSDLDEYIMQFYVRNDAVPNLNPQQDASQRMDVAPYIRSVEVSVQGGPYVTLDAVSGAQSANEMILYKPLLAPGLNTLRFVAKNRAYVGTTVDVKFYVFGVKYYYVSAAADGKSIQLSFVTSGVTFNSVFDLMRADVTAGLPEERIATIQSFPDNPDQSRQSYAYADSNITAGHEYHYRLIAHFTVHYQGRTIAYNISSGTISETALIPVESLISRVMPNPVGPNAVARFAVNIPQTFRGTTDRAPSSERRSSMSTEVKTQVVISVYNVLGVKIKTLMNEYLFGGYRMIEWDTKDSSGKRVPAGVYFVNVKAGPQKDTRKVVLLR